MGNSYKRGYPALLSCLFLFATSIASATTPLVYGDDLTAWINTAGEQHTYTFEGNTGDRIFIRVRGTSNGVDGCMHLYDPSGTLVADDCDDGGYVTIDGYDLNMTGTYTLTVQDHENNDTGFYGLGLQIVNNASYTTTISCDQDLAGTLSNQAEIDAYSYTANAGDVMVIQMRSALDNIESWLRLYDPAGNVLAEATPSGGLSRINTFSIPAGGTYTILAMDVNGNDTGDYGFSLQIIETDGCANYLNCGSISGQFDLLAQMHAFAIEAEANDLIYLYMRGGTSVEAELELYDSNGNEIAADNPNGGTAKIENFLIPAGGTYFVMVRDRKGNDMGTYGLSYYNVGNLECATLLDCEADINGSLDHLAELDVYYFEATAGDQVILQMRSTNSSLESELYLCNTSGTILAEDSPGGGMCEIADAVIPEDGTYFVFARDKHGNDLGDYGFSFQRLEATCGTLIECGSPEISSSIDVITGVDCYHFSGTAGDLISIDMTETGTELEPLLYVYDPDNNRIIDETASHDIHVTDFELPQTGTYLVLAMDRNGNDTGGYILNVDCPESLPPGFIPCDDLMNQPNPDNYCPQNMVINLNGEEGIQLNAYDLWQVESDCQFEFFHAHSLYFTCEDLGDNQITFSVLNDNQVLTVCDFVITVEGAPCPPSYCDSWGTANGNKFINSISVGSYTNESGNDGGYGDYTDEEIVVTPSTNLPVALEPSSIDNSKRKWRIWIDFNQDGTFSGNEEVFDDNGHGTLYGNIEIPDDALQGATRMRVSMKTGWAPDPCSTFTTGEVEDYTVVISGGAECGELPSPWSHEDIGNTTDGNACYDDQNNAFIVSSSGEDIYGTSDDFHFVHQDLCSEGYIIAKVTSITNTASYALAGVMIRQDLSASSPNTALLVRPENGLLFQTRYTSGGSTYDSDLDGGAPIWLKLERTPAMIIAYTSDNGQNWEQVYYSELEFDACVKVGLVVASNNEDDVNTSVFEQVQVEAFDEFGGGGSNYNFSSNTPIMEQNTAKLSSEEEVRKETKSKLTISCFPNPTSNYVNVDVSQLQKKSGTIKLYNSTGQIVWAEEKQSFEKDVYQIDAQQLQLPAGVYFVAVHFGKKAIAKSIYINNERN